MMYLILKETSFDNIDSIYDICNFTTDIDKANINIIGEMSIEPKFGRYLLIKLSGGSVSLCDTSKTE